MQVTETKELMKTVAKELEIDDPQPQKAKAILNGETTNRGTSPDDDEDSEEVCK